MKNNIIIAIASVAMMLCASCEKNLVVPEKGVGYLSFSEFSLGLDESVDTRATTVAASTYSIKIYNADEDLVVNTTYGEVTASDKNLSLPAGGYTLVASSSGDEVPVAEFEQAVYGVSDNFTIKAGELTEITEPLVCTLLQCKVTVDYADDFLKNVTGAGKTTVSVTAGYPLEYVLNANKTYDQSVGYFAVGENATMTVVFNGSYDGKNAKMTKTFTNIAAKQWRQIKFVPKVNEQGNATFDIVINDLVDDETLNSNVQGKEDILGEDPDAPKGDGGITLVPDYEEGCDIEITDLENIEIVPVETRHMVIRLKANVPAGVLKFTVDISSNSEAFLAAVDAADARKLDLINPLASQNKIFEVVPFPHGSDLLGDTVIDFDLSPAQNAITNFPGTHTFLMTVVDNDFCRKVITVKMVVK